jgi:hypothetical protein
MYACNFKAGIERRSTLLSLAPERSNVEPLHCAILRNWDCPSQVSSQKKDEATNQETEAINTSRSGRRSSYELEATFELLPVKVLTFLKRHCDKSLPLN